MKNLENLEKSFRYSMKMIQEFGSSGQWIGLIPSIDRSRFRPLFPVKMNDSLLKESDHQSHVSAEEQSQNERLLTQLQIQTIQTKEVFKMQIDMNAKGFN